MKRDFHKNVHPARKSRPWRSRIHPGRRSLHPNWLIFRIAYGYAYFEFFAVQGSLPIIGHVRHYPALSSDRKARSGNHLLINTYSRNRAIRSSAKALCQDNPFKNHDSAPGPMLTLDKLIDSNAATAETLLIHMPGDDSRHVKERTGTLSGFVTVSWYRYRAPLSQNALISGPTRALDQTPPSSEPEVRLDPYVSDVDALLLANAGIGVLSSNAAALSSPAFTRVMSSS